MEAQAAHEMLEEAADRASGEAGHGMPVEAAVEVPANVQARFSGGPGESGGSGSSPRDLLEHLQSITDSALGYMSLEEMISELLGRIRAGLGADTAAVLLLDEDRGVLVARAA